MSEDILISLVSFIVLASLVYCLYLVYWSSPRRFGVPYLIHFEDGVQVPNFLINPHFKNKVRIVAKGDKDITLQCKFNDRKLRSLIMEDYGLAENQFSITWEAHWATEGD